MNTILNVIPSPVRSTGAFVLHFLEMSIAMVVGMVLFMAIPGVMQLPPALHLLGMAAAMTLPMIAWMRIRGHGWRHGVEMSFGMLLPWAAVLALVGLGAAAVMPWLEHADGPAMFLGMLAVMLLRPGHFAQACIEPRDTRGVANILSSHSTRRIAWRRMFLVFAYVSAAVLAPAILGTVNLTAKLLPAGAVEPIQSPAYSGSLPTPPAADPTKKIAVVVSGPRGVEIGDAMEAYEVLARSDVFNVYVVAPERRPLSLNPGPMFGGSSIDFIPHFSFAEYDAQIGRAPDLIAIPWFDPAYSPEADAE